jgi:hypothetical protein
MLMDLSAKSNAFVGAVLAIFVVRCLCKRRLLVSLCCHSMVGPEC